MYVCTRTRTYYYVRACVRIRLEQKEKRTRDVSAKRIFENDRIAIRPTTILSVNSVRVREEHWHWCAVCKTKFLVGVKNVTHSRILK